MSHAKLGPSSAKRWMSCTPSVRYCEQFENTTSGYAEEGTAAHAYADFILLGDQKAITDFQNSNEYYCQEMEDAVDSYVTTVLERYQYMRMFDPNAILMTEQRLEFSEYVPGGFGTGDVVLIGDNKIEVIDLKYGKGVAVSAVDNPQLRIYGLGAYLTYSLIYDIDEVKMTIIQPRLDSITLDSMSVYDLIEWAETEVKVKAQMAWDGLGEFVAGDHCQFCPGKTRCKTLADYNMDLAKYDFKKSNLLTDLEIVDILNKVDGLKTWATSVATYALKEAENGTKWPGYKLVAGRSNRKFSDAQAVVSKLIAADYKEPLLYKPREVLGIGALEKLTGKKQFRILLDEFVIKPPGKPTFVVESDKREEINSAASAAKDFQ